MQVRVCESVDIDTMVDVSIDDLLNEFGERIEQAEERKEFLIRSVFLPLVDTATRLLARIPDKAIGRCKDSQREEVVKRLQAELDRWSAVWESVD